MTTYDLDERIIERILANPELLDRYNKDDFIHDQYKTIYLEVKRAAAEKTPCPSLRAWLAERGVSLAKGERAIEGLIRADKERTARRMIDRVVLVSRLLKAEDAEPVIEGVLEQVRVIKESMPSRPKVKK